ncbi:acyl carrier protein [Micromonospora aurantiaca (nom. illeg.)]|uniref:Acyl carrier protein n=2 Tax=Micromonospora aurantiaca (nom. illeg.) TaxID=47850 RepID=A0A1C6TP64_9ACTN|nr:acyl carrier protein [Micromonospora aurantiaca]ADL47540.1 phosphopantetheine-binding [Micromonospora aurantiaca ATCC 27029]AXH93419.1 acyl carrier protein [Micromonospora aurantiaca]MBC9000397.1 acyl carrier protein [Micromonospora aurantiaca]RNH97428.1 acyl carrier protein [Micromonospora aurantiaca]SCL43566.1 act minimal PKS acyl carrier protein [Micromonospora aurantiaca]
MSQSVRLSVPDLLTILATCAGEAEPVDAAAEDLGEVPLADLGYDSLALLEASSAVERRFGISLPEEEVAEVRTLNQLGDLVNDRLAQVR